MTGMEERLATMTEVLAEPLCAEICHLLGEPRILVSGEVSALLSRPRVAQALAPLLAEWRAEDRAEVLGDVADRLDACAGECGRPVDRVLPDPIPDGYECMWSEAMSGQALYCRACFEGFEEGGK